VEQDSPTLLHAVLQLWPGLPKFHPRTPAAAHVSSVELSMLPTNPSNGLLQAQSREQLEFEALQLEVPVAR